MGGHLAVYCFALTVGVVFCNIPPTSTDSASVDEECESPASSAQEGIRLTSVKLTGRVCISDITLQSSPLVLLVEVVEISNPMSSSFSIAASLVAEATQTEDARDEKRNNHRVRLGAFTVFPPNQTGVYQLSVSSSFAELSRVIESPLTADNVELELGIESVGHENTLDSLEVVIGSVTWGRD